MAILLLLTLVYLAAVAETTLVPLLRVGGAAPELLALLAVIVALRTRSRYGFLVPGLIVLAGDLTAPGRIGLGTAWMLLVAFVLVRWRAGSRLRRFPAQLAVVPVAVGTWAVGLSMTCRLLGEIEGGMRAILSNALGGAIYTAAVALPVLMVLGWWDDRCIEHPTDEHTAVGRARRLHLAG